MYCTVSTRRVYLGISSDNEVSYLNHWKWLHMYVASVYYSWIITYWSTIQVIFIFHSVISIDMYMFSIGASCSNDKRTIWNLHPCNPNLCLFIGRVERCLTSMLTGRFRIARIIYTVVIVLIRSINRIQDNRVRSRLLLLPRELGRWSFRSCVRWILILPAAWAIPAGLTLANSS